MLYVLFAINLISGDSRACSYRKAQGWYLCKSCRAIGTPVPPEEYMAATHAPSRFFIVRFLPANPFPRI